MRKTHRKARLGLYQRALVWALLVLVPALVVGPPVTAQKAKAKKKTTGQICITFDELPVASSFTETDAKHVTSGLLRALKNHKAPAAGFVVGNSIEGNYDLLGAWLNDGHLLGSLTKSHQDLHQLGWEPFIRDLSNGHNALEPMLAGFGQKQRFFRYPFLHYGNTVEAKREVKRYLAANDIFTAHATIVVEDYLYNLSLEKLGDEIDSADYFSIGDEYLDHVLEQLKRAEGQASEVLKRRCRHILLLRANQLNAEFLDELLTRLEEQGYRFISLDDALDDELYSAPEAYFGARGVGYIEMIRNSDSDLLPAE
ncbi:MAG: polysaccharide deacetylase family protein [candidate division Zixibacteria bacterium]|nr:polysaccharide deacetylase family protein [candidate division Zixibacteria bacterium]MDH3936805.1 polysaccharide deacetylase family protein [candidate division Zixibacteria bacterium]MDH4033210.1 polysaccharide deacetylase family protein [candidate division Zixibacteria bacterium]